MITIDRALRPQRLLEARLAAGYVRRLHLAQALGYGDATIVRNWETGVSEPSLYNFRRVCVALHVSADWLLGLED